MKGWRAKYSVLERHPREVRVKIELVTDECYQVPASGLKGRGRVWEVDLRMGAGRTLPDNGEGWIRDDFGTTPGFIPDGVGAVWGIDEGFRDGGVARG